MAAGAAMAVVGWWTGFKLGGFVCLEIAENFKTQVLISTGKLHLYS